VGRRVLGGWDAAVIQGAVFGLLMGADDVRDGRRWTETLPEVAVIAVGFAFFVWLFVYRRQGRETNLILAGLTRYERRVANRAAVRGAMPTDPQVRSAAAELVRYRLGQSLNHRTPAAFVFAVLVLVCLGVAAGNSPWWYAGAGVFAAVLATMWIMPRRLTRRLELLGGLRA
jgi:Flp pilus assembly protein TadB